MRKAAAIILAVILAVSCDSASSVGDMLTENPFSDPIDLSIAAWHIEPEINDGVLEVSRAVQDSPYEDESIIRFPLITDVHVLRDRRYDDVVNFREELIGFLSDNSFPFIVNLGDTLDHGRFSEPEFLDFISRAGNAANGNFLYAIGNHELHDETSASFDRFLSALHPGHETSRMARYVYGPLSIYKLDNSKRTFGREQLEYLEEALKCDPNPYRIFFAHEIIAAGGQLDQTLSIFGIDPEEANRLLRLMDDYHVSIIFTGHHHKGNSIYRHQDDLAEFNAAAAHRRDAMGFESMGYWYVIEIDMAAEEIRIIPYSAETGERAADGDVIKTVLSRG